MFNYFDTTVFNNKKIIDIWKRYSLNIISEDFTIHKLSEGDNLMSISYKYYNTINDWWIIYLFNELYDINFSLLQSNVLINTIDDYKYKIENYSSLLKKEQLKIFYLIRNMYINIGNNIQDANNKTNTLLTSLPADEIIIASDYINLKITEDSFFNQSLKIPNTELSKEIKNTLYSFSKNWKK